MSGSSLRSDPVEANPVPDADGRADQLAKGGVLLGGGMTSLAALMTLIAFVLPWASCGGMTLNGPDLARNTGVLGLTLFLVPLAALGAMALGALEVVLGLIGKGFRTMAIVAGTILPACVVSWLVYLLCGLRLLLERQVPIRFEFGFFLAGLTQAGMTAGGILALVAALKGSRSASAPTARLERTRTPG